MDKFFSLQNMEIVIDIEATGVDVWKDKPFMIGVLADGVKQGCYDWTSETIQWLEKELPLAERIINHNIKYDLMIASNSSFDWKKIENQSFWCTQVNAAVINEHEPEFSLDAIYFKYFNKPSHKQEFYDRMAEIFGGPADKSQMKNISKAPKPLVVEYLRGDLIKTWEVYQFQKKEIAYQDLIQISNLENQVTPVLVSIERRGVPISFNALKPARKKIDKLVSILQKEINDMAGMEINVNSGRDLEKAFEKLKLPIERKSDTGNPSFTKDRLDGMDHPFGPKIIELRSALKMNNTFIDGYISRYNEETGRIHTNFNQTKGDEYGVHTGRLSSSNPNLMQVPNPKRGRRLTAEIIRSLFAAPKGTDWYSGDWSQFEFRIFAHYTKDENIIRAYNENPDTDFHQATADLTGVPRNPQAKRINLGLVFGMGEGKLAWELGLPVSEIIGRNGKKQFLAGEEAKELFNTYHSRFPGAKQVLKQAESLARSRGWVKTILGRKLHFPNRDLCYKAGGLVFQGSAADLMKRSLIQLERVTRGNGAELILPVHDEFNVIGEKGKHYTSMIKTIMEDIPELRVPVIANIGKGRNWFDASK